ncbi:hypothetical protein Tco_0058861 [Tanacetum coccineum]
MGTPTQTVMQGNIMDEVDIEDLTIEQYIMLTQENQIPKKVDDMTIAEYMEYEETMKNQDYDEYQPHSTKSDERNNRVHAKPSRNEHQVAKIVVEMVRLKLASISFKNKLQVRQMKATWKIA